MTGKYNPYWESLVTFLLIFFLKKKIEVKCATDPKDSLATLVLFFFCLLLFPDDSRLAARHSTPSISF